MKLVRVSIGDTACGMACGPTGGSDSMELVVMRDGREVFLHMSHFEDAYQLRIARESMIDLETEFWESSDAEDVLERMNARTMKLFDWSAGDLLEYQEAKGSEYGKAIELLDTILCKYVQCYGSYETFEEWLGEEITCLEGKEIEKIEIPAVSAPWNEEEAYEDGVLYAHDLKCGETDEGGWTDVIMAECTVENKRTGRTVTAYADTPGCGIYELLIAEKPMLEAVLESGEVLPPEEILEQAVEFYGSFEEARASEYYEVFRRLMFSLEEML